MTPPDTSSLSGSLRQDQIERAVIEALESAPPVFIPADFAARVAAEAVRLPASSRGLVPGWGPRLAAVSGAILMLAMFFLAPHARASLTNIAFDGEMLLLTELAAIVWMSSGLFFRDDY